MKRKSTIELQRQRIALMLRGQASIVRAEFLNEVLPAALEAFDEAVAEGKAIEVNPIDIKTLIDNAVAEVTGRQLNPADAAV